MPRSKGKAGDFHQGVPDKHLGNKGDQSEDIRSSAEARNSEPEAREQDSRKSESNEEIIEELRDSAATQRGDHVTRGPGGGAQGT